MIKIEVLEEKKPEYQAEKETNLIDAYDLELEKLIIKNEGIWKCTKCEKSSKLKGNIKNHAEKHINGVLHSCHFCNKLSKSRHGLKAHMEYKHSDKSFCCKYCDKVETSRKALNNHNIQVHNVKSTKLYKVVNKTH